MNRKLPKWLSPSKGEKQAYAVTNADGYPMVRQSMRMEDGRVVYLEMTPNETQSLITDLMSACGDAADLACGAEFERPADRF